MKENRKFIMATKEVKVENIKILIVSIQEYTTIKFCNKKNSIFCRLHAMKKKNKQLVATKDEG